ncbi:MAG: acetyl-CoA carboxylase biotin carboxyl carrier protein [Parvularcula sp.]
MSKSTPLENDLAAIRALAEVLDETGLSEVEIERDAVRIRLSRTATVVAQAPAAAIPPASGQTPQTPPTDDAQHPGAVTSPMVGTAYMAAQPGAAPFVKTGDMVSAGQTLMIVEAMKTMNEIKAPLAGKVTKIVAQDSTPVEFGEVLMIIE